MANRTTGCPFPIGSIFITTDKSVPTWIRPGTYRVPFGKGRCLVCVNDESQSENLKTAEKEFGTAQTQLTLVWQSINTWDEWSADVLKDVTPNTWWKITINNYQPSITVYMRKRVYNKTQVPEYNAFNITDEQATDKEIYGENAIYDFKEEEWEIVPKAKQPDPYNP